VIRFYDFFFLDAFGGSNPDLVLPTLGIPFSSVLVWTSSAGQPDFRLQEAGSVRRMQIVMADMMARPERLKNVFIFLKS
jgi:hypothetical protein